MSAPPGLLIAATNSGAGKTTLTLGLLRALTRRGLRVGAAKCGPDYIDPGLHALACGRSSFNLDSWAMRPGLLSALRAQLERDADLVVCEGVMGLFDGRPDTVEQSDGSSASVAARMDWPVLLVVDVTGQAQSVAAVVRGFAAHRADVRLLGVVLNRVASPRHQASCRAAIEATGVPVLGALPRAPDLQLPERHLGLVQALDTQQPEARLDALAAFVESHLELSQLLERVRLDQARRAARVETAIDGLTPPGQHIALAHDRAFSFVYPHLLEGWRRKGAELSFFSPLANQGPDPRADVCWLPGGYPELHAPQLAANHHFLQSVRSFAERRPVHGECGGYMVMGETLVDASGAEHALLGLLGHRTSFARRKLTLGYRAGLLAQDCPLGARGSWLRGHEFHYATLHTPGDDAPLFERVEGTTEGCVGTRRGLSSGSFFHFIDKSES
ncbi:MAG TPA: cobyrinate a,c-diamide synthase [Polyangiales bacterium]